MLCKVRSVGKLFFASVTHTRAESACECGVSGWYVFCTCVFCDKEAEFLL